MSLMAQEAIEAPAVVERFLSQNDAQLKAVAARLRSNPPSVILTAARGSSDHAATYLKYMVEILLGVPCASMGASVTSVWHAKLMLENAVCVTISQSGQSPDILSMQAAAKRAGALTIAIVNQTDSPVARQADICFPLCAGAEKSVAATKTFIASLAAGAAMTAAWHRDAQVMNGLRALPEQLDQAGQISWPDQVQRLSQASSLYVLGRGPGLAIAAETALKMKETCALHAESLSFAEVMHGPLELVGPGFPVLAFSPEDGSHQLAKSALARITLSGADVFVVGKGGLPYCATQHPMLDPISMVQTAYLNIERLARARGRDPDRPRHLSKVTETV